ISVFNDYTCFDMNMSFGNLHGNRTQVVRVVFVSTDIFGSLTVPYPPVYRFIHFIITQHLHHSSGPASAPYYTNRLLFWFHSTFSPKVCAQQPVNPLTKKPLNLKSRGLRTPIRIRT